jgi:hypothetical protein
LRDALNYTLNYKALYGDEKEILAVISSNTSLAVQKARHNIRDHDKYLENF